MKEIIFYITLLFHIGEQKTSLTSRVAASNDHKGKIADAKNCTYFYINHG